MDLFKLLYVERLKPSAVAAALNRRPSSIAREMEKGMESGETVRYSKIAGLCAVSCLTAYFYYQIIAIEIRLLITVWLYNHPDILPIFSQNPSLLNRIYEYLYTKVLDNKMNLKMSWYYRDQD